VALALALSSVVYGASPVDLGLAELNAAMAARNPKYKPRIVTEINLDPPETFRIEPYTAGGGRIAGGDLRGLMYGLLEAADQIRGTGRLKQTHGLAALTPRGVRVTADPGSTWFGSESYWTGLMQTLARNRFNRAQLLFERFPGKDLFPSLRIISQTGASYGVDLALGIKSAPDNFGPLLQELLSQCSAIRSVSLVASEDALKTPVQQVLGRAGRRVLLEDNHLWQIDPAQVGSDEESAKGVIASLTSGFEVALPQGADGRPDARAIGVWGRLGYSGPPVPPPKVGPRSPGKGFTGH
jgi:hypothetical protein